jgi:hypothetical protein
VHPSARSRALPRIALVLASTVLALLAAEAIARLVGVPPQFGRVIDAKGLHTRTVDGVVLWSYDNLRYDPAEIRRVAAAPGAFKIVGFGDSIMYGVWLSKQQTYLEQARRLLSSRSPRPVETLNMAVPGFNTVQENALYEETAGAIRPDLVIVHYWGDDVRQYRMVGGHVVDFADMGSDGRIVVRALPLPPGISDFLLVHSSLYDLLTHAMLTYRRLVQPYDWTRVSEPLSEMDDRVRSAGGRLLVLASAELDGPVPKTTADLPMLQQLAASRGIEVIDLTQWLPGVSSKDIALDGCHFNAEGHRLIAEHLVDYLLQHDLKQ